MGIGFHPSIRPMTTRRFVKSWYKRRLRLATCLQWLSGSQPSPDSGLEPSIRLVLRDIRRNIAYTPWPLTYCPPHFTSFYLSNITSFLSVLLSHFQPNTDTGHLVLFQDCGSILLAVGRLDYIVITHMCPNLLIIFAREPQWAIWWSNQDLHLTHTMLTPYNWHYRSSHANYILLIITLVTMLAYSTLSFI